MGKNKAMEDTLNWFRNNDLVIDDDPKEDLVVALSKVTGVSMPKKMKPKQKKTFVEDSVAWLRENDSGRLDTVDDATVEILTKLAGISYEARPLSKDKNKNKAMEDALNWSRNNDSVYNDSSKEDLVVALSKVTSVSMTNTIEEKQIKSRSLYSRKKRDCMEKTLIWIRNNEPIINFNPKISLVKALNKITGKAMPKKLTKKAKKKFVEDSIDWLREN